VRRVIVLAFVLFCGVSIQNKSNTGNFYSLKCSVIEITLRHFFYIKRQILNLGQAGFLLTKGIKTLKLEVRVCGHNKMDAYKADIKTDMQREYL